MRLPRLTTRRSIIAVALAAILLAGVQAERRRERYLAKAQAHAAIERLYQNGMAGVGGPGIARSWSLRDPKMSAYHARLKEKYERAARYPWLSVAPDPPDPWRSGRRNPPEPR